MAGIFDNDLILPGVITEIMSDYNQGYDTSQFGTTDSVVVMGTAFSGPVGTQVRIYSPEHARYIFGDIYDSKKKKQTTLVAEIQNAWDRGCRTIYAVRVSGKPIYKDFELALDTNLKLRMSGMFPSNGNKDIYMTYDDTPGSENITFYKPAEKTTIQEKMMGVVDNPNSIIKNVIALNQAYGLTKDSRLVDLIKIVNELPYNNVFRLEIVNENGNDITMTSAEAQSLQIGALFPGLYLIGRNKNYCNSITNKVYVIANEVIKPFDDFTGSVFKKLKINTDVNEDLPIYSENLSTLNSIFNKVNISMDTLFDFLEVPGKLDLVYGKDDIDYEETDISNFELYKRLGSGYSITSQIVKRGENNYVVKETAVSDPNRIVSLEDGIYSMLENLNTNYRALTCGYADEKLEARLPRKEDFKSAFALNFTFLKDKIADNKVNLISVSPKIDKTDLTESKKYKFKVQYVPYNYVDKKAVLKALYTEKTIKRVSVHNNITADFATDDLSKVTISDLDGKVYKNGTLIMNLDKNNKGILFKYPELKTPIIKTEDLSDLTNNLYMVGSDIYKYEKDANGNVVFVKAVAADFGTSKYVLVESGDTVSIYELQTSASNLVIEPIGELNTVLSDDEDKTYITIEDEYLNDNVITIKSSALDYLTLEGFLEVLNANRNLNKLFDFKIANNAINLKNETILDMYIPVWSSSLSLAVGDLVKNNNKIYKTLIAQTAGTDIKFDTTINFNEVTGVIDIDSSPLIAIKEIRYDTNLYIPYRTTDNFARHLAQHCQYTSLKTAPTHGIIGCLTLVDINLNSIAYKINSLLSIDYDLYAKKPNGNNMLDKNNLPYPIGKNISVVVSQHIVDTASSYNYNYISNGAAAYAGMVSDLPLDQSSTSQPINISSLLYDLTNYQLQKLTQKGYVTFKQSYTKGIVVTDGVTMAPPTSPTRRLSVSRIMNAVEQVIRRATEPFIGKQNHLTNRNSMQTAIKSELENLKGTLIEAYEFNILIDPTQFKLGIIDIEYRTVPIYEIREVRNKIQIVDSLS